MRSKEIVPTKQLTEIPLGTGIITIVHPEKLKENYKYIEKGWFEGFSTIRSANTHDRITTIVLNKTINQANHNALLAFCQHRLVEGDSVSFSENPDLEDENPVLTAIQNAIEVYANRVSQS